jgi:hypothetical protein
LVWKIEGKVAKVKHDICFPFYLIFYTYLMAAYLDARMGDSAGVASLLLQGTNH